MLTDRLALILALIGLAKALDAIAFIEGSLEGVEECRQKNNISTAEYRNFTEFDNIDNVLNETVVFKYKCHFKCLMERQPEKWLNDQGKMDLERMNVTREAAEGIAECMAQAAEEPCAYAFKLVICVLKNEYPSTDYEETDTTFTTFGPWEEQQLEQLDTPESGQQTLIRIKIH